MNPFQSSYNLPPGCTLSDIDGGTDSEFVSTCYGCGHEFDRNDMTKLDGDLYCSGCAEPEA